MREFCFLSWLYLDDFQFFLLRWVLDHFFQWIQFQNFVSKLFILVYFLRFGKILITKLVKNVCHSFILRNYHLFCIFIVPDKTFFSIFFFLDFDLKFSVNASYDVFQNVVLSLTCRRFIPLKSLFFSCAIKVTQKLRCLLYAFRSVLLFELKNLFYRWLFFTIPLLILTAIKVARLVRTYRFFRGACFSTDE